MTTNISLSFELICLLNWLLKNKKQDLNSLTKQALENGFLQDLEALSYAEEQKEPDQLYTTVLEFLIFMEESLAKNLETIYLDNATKEAIYPALKKIDLGNLDAKTILISMQQTKSKIRLNRKKSLEQNKQNPTNILWEQILKNWKPTKKEPMN